MKTENSEEILKILETAIYALVASYTGAGMYYLSENLHLGIILAALTGMLFIAMEMEEEE